MHITCRSLKRNKAVKFRDFLYQNVSRKIVGEIRKRWIFLWVINVTKRKLILTKLYENGNKYILYIFTAYK